MDIQIVLQLLVLAATVELRAIQVYEEVDEAPLVPLPRNSQRIYFSGVAQPDQLKWRYFQQQKVDARNRARNKLRLHKGKPFASIRKREAPSNARLLNLGLDHNQNLQLIQESLRVAHQDKEIQALNALLGQSPTAQLQGLSQLLRPKDHTPITEELVDIANPQMKPNIKVEHAPLELQEAVARGYVTRSQAQQRIKQIEKELNAVAQAQAREAIEKAQQAAFADVQAQHQAMVAAQSQAAQAAIQKARSIFNIEPVLVQPKEEAKGQVYSEENDDDLIVVAIPKPKYSQYASQYAFGYQVRDFHSSNNFGHEEIHDGNSAKGNYHVLLPDGRLQHVQYWADETGFHAKVTYDKVAQHPYQ